MTHCCSCPCRMCNDLSRQVWSSEQCMCCICVACVGGEVQCTCQDLRRDAWNSHQCLYASATSTDACLLPAAAVLLLYGPPALPSAVLCGRLDQQHPRVRVQPTAVLTQQCAPALLPNVMHHCQQHCYWLHSVQATGFNTVSGPLTGAALRGFFVHRLAV
jgi:hypothetical protein